ncbi:OTU protein [Lecanora helva]
MEDLRRKHRQEQKELNDRVIQKKKAATKKTRKGIHDECANLERQLKETQDEQLLALNGDFTNDTRDGEVPNADEPDTKEQGDTRQITNGLESLEISTTTSNTIGRTKKPNRQKARLARRAAEQDAAVEEAQKEAADVPNLRDQERESMLKAFAARGLTEYEIRSDGHCLYAAIADQLRNLGSELKPTIKIAETESEQDRKGPSIDYKVTRQVAAAYISQNPNDFTPFLEAPLDVYVKTIEETGEWGGHLEILALAKAYAADINVLQGDGNVQKIECGLQDDHPELWLAYYRHSFGLGEHYNSLRNKVKS